MSSKGLGMGRVAREALVVSGRRLLLHLHLRLGELLAVGANGKGPVVEVVLVVAVVQGLHGLDLAAEDILLEPVTDPFELILRMNCRWHAEDLIQFLQSEPLRLREKE